MALIRARGESVHGGANAMMQDRRGRSVHGGKNYWRILRAAATAAKWHNREPILACSAHSYSQQMVILPMIDVFLQKFPLEHAVLCLSAGSVHGTNDYLRWIGRTEEERAEQRKAARLCLDTSAHAGSEYRRLVSVLSDVGLLLS